MIPEESIYRGAAFTVIHCKGAKESLGKALAQAPFTPNKRKSMRRATTMLINRLADTGRLSKANFPKEGELPKRPGQDNGRFYTFKKNPIRGYVWLSKTHPATYFISHYIYKKQDKLSSADTGIVHCNWSRIEENGDEC